MSVHDKNTPASSNTAQDGQAVVVCCTLELAFHRGKLQTDAGSDETFAQASSSDPQVCRSLSTTWQDLETLNFAQAFIFDVDPQWDFPAKA